MLEFSTVVPTSTGSSVLRFLIVSIDAKVNMIHRRGNKFGRVVRTHGAVANVDLWSVQLRDALHAPCMLCCADNFDDVYDGVRWR